jgi:hypothetical protein
MFVYMSSNLSARTSDFSECDPIFESFELIPFGLLSQILIFRIISFVFFSIM